MSANDRKRAVSKFIEHPRSRDKNDAKTCVRRHCDFGARVLERLVAAIRRCGEYWPLVDVGGCGYERGVDSDARFVLSRAADLINRTAPLFLRYPVMKIYWTRFTVTGTGRQTVLQTVE